TDVKSSVDEELDAYNRYLFELSRNGLRKQWRSPSRTRPDAGSDSHGTSSSAAARHVRNRQEPSLGPADGEE
ncbi:MAG: hypothetical protein ACRDV8_03840, partial [Acidimicrobiales bacterium]